MSTVRFVSQELAGFRSFGPDRTERLELEESLSVIVGRNGSGKSTLVEVLRYAVTGELPGGSKDGRGHPFINDPGQRSASVPAFVRVEFLDTMGRRVRIDRSLKLSKRGKTYTLKSDPPVINRWDDASKRFVAISNKIMDTNAEMSLLLGVRPAILKYVVFCTQEDSLWPMAEPKALLEKFEDIFDSKRYRLLIKGLKTILKEKNTELRELKAKLPGLEQNKETAAEKNDQLKEAMSKKDKLTKEAEVLKTQLQPVLAAQDELNKRGKELARLSNRRTELTTSLKHKEDRRELLRNADLPRGSADELSRQLESFQGQSGQRQRRCDQLTSCVQKDKQNILSFRGRLADVGQEQASLRAQEKMAKGKEEERDQAIVHAARHTGVSGFASHDAPFDELQCASFKKKADRCVEEAEKSLIKAHQSAEEAKSRLRKDKEDTSNRVTSLQTTQKLKTEEAGKNREELKETKRRLSGAEEACRRKKDASRQLERVRRELEDSRQDLNEPAHLEHMERLRQQKAQLEKKAEELEKRVKRAQEALKDRTELGMLENDLKKKQDERDERPVEKLCGLLKLPSKPEPEPASLVRGLQTALDAAQKARRDNEASQTTLTAEKSAAEAQLRDLEAQIASGEKEQKKKEAEVAKVLGQGRDLMAELDSVSDRKEKLNKQRGQLAGHAALFRDFQAQLKKDAACPLCERGCGAAEKRKLTTKIEETLAGMKTEKETLRELEEAERRREALESVREADQTSRRLAEESLPQLRKTRAVWRGKLKEACRGLEEAAGCLAAAVVRETSLAALQQRFVGWEALCGDLRRLADDAELKRRQIGSAQRLDLQEEQSSLNRALDDAKNVDKDLQQRDQTFFRKKEAIVRLQTSENNLTGELNKIQGDLQSQSSLADKERDLEKEIAAAMEAAEQARNDVQPLGDRIKQLENELSDLNESSSEDDKKLRKNISELKSKVEEVERLTREAAKLREASQPAVLASLEEEEAKLGAELTELQASSEQHQKELAEAEAALNEGESFRRRLKDALELAGLDGEVEGLVRELGRVKAEMGPLADADLETERSRLKRSVDELSERLGQTQTSLARAAQAEAELTKDLQRTQYASAQRDFNRAVLEVKVREGTLLDLVKVMKIREQAMAEHHRAQMEELNEVLALLWSETYQGQDISAVRVATEDESKSVTVSEAGVAKYSYSVQMQLAATDVWLDMRQRCSAGQRVLACLLIRLALAEIFADRCGFLVLDEPTTNVDEANAGSLARALALLVHRKNRLGRHHFQLLLITHDRGFVDQLIRNHPHLDLAPQHYVHVSKDASGHSQLRSSPTLHALHPAGLDSQEPLPDDDDDY